MNLLAISTTLNAYFKTFRDLAVFPPSPKEKKISLMNCIWRFNIKSWSQAYKSARWLASSAKSLHYRQILQLLEPTSSQLVIPSKTLGDYRRFLKVLFPFHYSLKDTIGKSRRGRPREGKFFGSGTALRPKPSAEPQSLKLIFQGKKP